MTKEERLQEIEHAKDFLIDIIPYNTQNFMEVLQETAEAYVDSMYDDNIVTKDGRKFNGDTEEETP